MNKVHLTDCMDFMVDKPNKYYDLAICDPPYGIGDTFISCSTGKKPGKLERIHKKIQWDNAIPTAKYFNELIRISKKQIIWGANYFNCFNEGGAIVWYKNKGAPSLSQCEIASVSNQKKVDYVFIQSLGGFLQKEKNIHPTQKPIALYKWLLQNYAKPDQTIFDSHVGSGSIRIACFDLGLDFEGCEIDPDYWQAQENRYNTHILQGWLFGKAEMQDLIYGNYIEESEK